MNSLGIFKGKEKKSLQAQIDQLNSRLPSIDESIEKEKNDQMQLYNSRIKEIEQTLKPVKDKLNDVQKRLNEINTELTQNR